MQPTIKGISKRIILSILLMGFMSQIFSQSTTPILDSNFEEALVNLNIDTNGLNGNILNSDASQVFHLNVSYEYIQDLSGIEAFTSLKTLNCSNNDLSLLDISQNNHLEELKANDNSLSSINVSSNTKLSVLELASNSLSSIDVSGNFSLTDLSVSLNNLSTIDVSANSNLEFLGCYSNFIEDLNLLSNTQLRYLHVDFNDLNELDLSQNFNIKTVSCSGNNLSALSTEYNTELSYLDCRNNNITSLDLNTNTDLERLFVCYNNINEIDLSNAPELLFFYAKFNNLTTLDISNNPVLKRIKCEGNNLSTVDFRNGNNVNISEFIMTDNSNLSCIFVDDANASFLANWLIDDISAFVENESDCEALSIDEANSDVFTFDMFPNPATENISISIQTQEAKLEMYSLKGQLMHSQNLAYGRNDISLDAYSSGLYLVKIISEETSETKKLLIY
ncbi:T9SS type A sorting domain-containing protein [Xanthomarina sp. F2636L]|uniref:T9SS type A sorting domain-containing protein n=1 Tax=Xanthomarina sp. F2636L TaxID=2996018 RepID=UPI00225E446F|nr:T9SS type A sorting domain-containing protein [Xanthomarina sp. F2636L]MCX7549555.1 T9SS type A sorting domain-containing protein [Xanthomarina sp. F2636L]